MNLGEQNGMGFANGYLAHVAEDGRQEPLINHLREVSQMAGEFADSFGCREVAKQIGLVHDIGKYSASFQRRIRGSSEQVDHSTAGAYAMLSLGSWWGAYCVAGHHGGLIDGGADTNAENAGTLAARMRKAEEGKIEDCKAFKAELDEVSLQAVPVKPFTFPTRKSADDLFSNAFATRMMFSCLVDADFLCTERFLRNGEREGLRTDSLDVLAERFEDALEAKFQKANSESGLNKIRRRISDECLQAAALEPGIFSLTVPTGGGKTYASVRFALRHATKYGMRRVIYAVPYTSIIEQNAEALRAVLDVDGSENVLEHHANLDLADKGDGLGERLRLATENWDAPIVMTTNVQFFESLFAAKTSRCRKLHNIARSVIVLDEAQALPTEHLKPCLRAVAELVVNYGCTLVLCSATQPAFEGFFAEMKLSVHEIVSSPQELAARLERVTYENAGRLSNDELARRLVAEQCALCIVDNKKQARDLYDLVKGKNPEGVFHLSTFMHSKHRMRTIEEIRERLSCADGKPCRVISTSLIEAGVDIDFPVVYRSFAGIDSIVQAAGRCNREGKLGHAGGRVVVFDPADGIKLPLDIKNRAGASRKVVREYIDDDFSRVGTLASINAYFRELFWLRRGKLDTSGALEQLSKFSMCANGKALSFPFRTVADGLKMIDEGSVPVIVPDEAVAEAIDALQGGYATGGDMRRLSSYTVNLYDDALRRLMAAGAVKVVGDGMYLLEDGELYDRETGLNADFVGGKGIQL